MGYCKVSTVTLIFDLSCTRKLVYSTKYLKFYHLVMFANVYWWYFVFFPTVAAFLVTLPWNSHISTCMWSTALSLLHFSHSNLVSSVWQLRGLLIRHCDWLLCLIIESKCVAFDIHFIAVLQCFPTTAPFILNTHLFVVFSTFHSFKRGSTFFCAFEKRFQ